jgi:FKBP-type peptidyl-prolyl cis-trans isomerase
MSACASLLAFSCAKIESEVPGAAEAQSLEKWMAAHVTDPALTAHPDGLYTLVLQQAADPQAKSPVDGNWVDVNFTGYALPVPPMAVYPENGSVFVTRDAEIAAKELGNNPYRTHYAPQRMLVSGYYGGMTAAMLRTLAMMKKGEKRRMFAPSTIAYGSYGSSYSYGYQGQNALPGGVPSYMDIELVEVIEDIAEHEQDQVWEYAGRVLGKSADTDTLRKGIYLNAEYFGIADPEDTAKDTITADSTVNIYYVGRFLDGFVFDTNIDTVAQRAWGTGGNLQPLSYKPSSGELVQAFYEAVTKMRYDSRGSMVFTSEWGYSYSGQTPTTENYATQIDPYTPLVFDFYIAPYEAKSDLVEGAFLTPSMSDGWGISSEKPSWKYVPYNSQGYLSISGDGLAVDGKLLSPLWDLSTANEPRLYLSYRFIKGETGKTSSLKLLCSNDGQWSEIPLTSFPAGYTTIGPIKLDSYSPGANFGLQFVMDSGGEPTDARWDIAKVEFRQLVESDEN